MRKLCEGKGGWLIIADTWSLFPVHHDDGRDNTYMQSCF